MLHQLEDDQWGNAVYRYTRNPFHGTRRQRNMAHKKLIEGVRKRGFLRPGEEPTVDLEELKIDLKNATWETFRTQMAEMMQKVEERTKKLTEKRPDYDHLVNAETGQKIYMKELFFATTLWSIEEVLELIPNRDF